MCICQGRSMTNKPAANDPEEIRRKLLLSTRKGRKAVIAVGGTTVRLIDVAAYRRYIDRSNNIAVFKRLQFVDGKACCTACGWQPPIFLTDRHKRTFLAVHHLLPVSDGSLDDVGNLIILCPNCHSLADYLPSIIVLPYGEEHRSALIDHLRLLNNDPEEWQRQYNSWKTCQKRKAVYSLRDADSNYDGVLEVFLLR